MTTLPLESTPLPEEPNLYDMDEANAERLHRIAAFGFTDRQARFLLEVLLHSGVFLERQYCQFSRIVHGQKSTDFIRSLVDRHFASPIAPGKLHRGRLFHVHYKPLWAAVGEADSRFRKRATAGRMIERVMVLDAILDDRDVIWLGPAVDKRRHFMTHLRDRFDRADLPQLRFGDGRDARYRYFPDKLPIGWDRRFTDRHVFVYLAAAPTPWEFRLFLLRHIPLLRLLTQWTIRVLLPKTLAHARRPYLHAARDHLLGTARGRKVDILEAVFKQRRQLAEPNAAPPYEHYERDSTFFPGPRFRALYQQWLVDPRAIWMADSLAISDAIDRGHGRIECVDLTRQYLHLSPLVTVA